MWTVTFKDDELVCHAKWVSCLKSFPVGSASSADDSPVSSTLTGLFGGQVTCTFRGHASGHLCLKSWKWNISLKSLLDRRFLHESKPCAVPVHAPASVRHQPWPQAPAACLTHDVPAEVSLWGRLCLLTRTKTSNSRLRWRRVGHDFVLLGFSHARHLPHFCILYDTKQRSAHPWSKLKASGAAECWFGWDDMAASCYTKTWWMEVNEAFGMLFGFSYEVGLLGVGLFFDASPCSHSGLLSGALSPSDGTSHKMKLAH